MYSDWFRWEALCAKLSQAVSRPSYLHPYPDKSVVDKDTTLEVGASWHTALWAQSLQIYGMSTNHAISFRIYVHLSFYWFLVRQMAEQRNRPSL